MNSIITFFLNAFIILCILIVIGASFYQAYKTFQIDGFVTGTKFITAGIIGAGIYWASRNFILYIPKIWVNSLLTVGVFSPWIILSSIFNGLIGIAAAWAIFKYSKRNDKVLQRILIAIVIMFLWLFIDVYSYAAGVDEDYGKVLLPNFTFCLGLLIYYVFIHDEDNSKNNSIISKFLK